MDFDWKEQRLKWYINLIKIKTKMFKKKKLNLGSNTCINEKKN